MNMPQKTTQKTIDKTAILLTNYKKLVAAGKIQNDDAQLQVLALLQNVLDGFKITSKNLSSRSEARDLFIIKDKILQSLSLLQKDKNPQSLYIWGNVGRGKSMLMDLFFAAAPAPKKRRIHFHAFMQEIHARIHTIRKSGHKSGAGDPVAILAKQIANETTLLCFDELQATDVADASILYRLFEGLFTGGVCIVSTSNRPPAELYTGGVQAERFANFINLIKEKMTIAALSSDEDYRYRQGENEAKTYHYPLGAGADNFIAENLARFGIRRPATAITEILPVHGREIEVKTYPSLRRAESDEAIQKNKQEAGLRRSARNDEAFKIAIFTFAELCKKPLGAADYLAIAKKYPIVFLTDIPALAPEQRNEAKRFVILIDTLYEHKTKLIITAATSPEQIYQQGDGAFEFHRTVSRLTEIDSFAYQQQYLENEHSLN